MKISLKLLDIEVMIEDENEKNRKALESEALECIDALLQSRINLESQFNPAEDETGSKPDQPEHKIRPDITMASLYA